MVVKEGVKYEGESGSNGYSRGGEHFTALDLKQEDNALWKHCLVAHGGEKVEFSMKVVGTFQSCLARQVNEGVRIKRSSAQLMNRKGEFHQHQVVRVVPMRGLNNEPGEMAESRGRGRGQAGRRSSRDGERPESINYSDMIFFLTISHFFVLFFWRRVD